ncbi:hypothetical protein L484_001812 [Morus notabilis]|uniref:Uncharacterized protein n=1 Tax=Morus notabilis TaxID=981085 RepID=W9RFF8_9ROSA|nr:hypothetical protein L484_001812 [Morus notabilis]
MNLISGQLADNAGGTKDVQVSRVPTAEGRPRPSDLPVRKPFMAARHVQYLLSGIEKSRFNMQEPHKAAFEYHFELVAALKHMLSTSCSLRSFAFVSFKMLILAMQV